MDTLTPSTVIEEYQKYKLHDSGVRSRGMASANHVTALVHECEAYSIYNRTVPGDKRRKIESRLAMVFAEGNDQSRIVKRDLMDAGFEIEEQEGQMVWPAFEIVGHQDFAIRKPGFARIKTELKSCAPYTYESINSVDDLRNHRWSFIQKWYRQIVLYMLLQNAENYWLMLKNKSTGGIKIVEFRLGDEELRDAEEILRKAQRVNEAVHAGREPEEDQKISSPDACAECEFFNVCLPDLAFGARAEVLNAETAAELEKALDRRKELEAAHKEYEAIDDDVKTEIKRMAGQDIGEVVIGSWLASLKFQEVKPETKLRAGFTKTVIKFVRTET